MRENYDEQIDRTLHALGSAKPGAGLEERLVARLAIASEPRPRFFRLPQLGFGLAAAVLGCAVIVAGSVSHSRHMVPVAPGLRVLVTGGSGVGAASAAHVAREPVTALPHDRPRSVREITSGRAVISPHAKRKAGVAAPKALPAPAPSR